MITQQMHISIECIIFIILGKTVMQVCRYVKYDNEYHKYELLSVTILLFVI